MQALARTFYALTGVVCILPAITLGGLEHFNIYSAFMVGLGTVFSILAIVEL